MSIYFFLISQYLNNYTRISICRISQIIISHTRYNKKLGIFYEPINFKSRGRSFFLIGVDTYLSQYLRAIKLIVDFIN